MKSRFMVMFWVVTVLLFCQLSGADQEKNQAVGPAIFQFDPFLIEHLPGGYFYPSFLENFAPDTTLLIEENNGFSLLDNPRVYFEGDSFTQFNWFYNGVNINSALNPGSPAVLLPFSTISRFRLTGENPASKDHGLDFGSVLPGQSFSKVTASWVYPDLGGYWATFMIKPEHPTIRGDRLYKERRQIDHNFFLDYQLSKVLANANFLFAVNYYDTARQFNDFTAFDHTFTEEGKLLMLNARFKKEIKNGSYDLFSIFNYLDRDNQGAEIGSYPQETIGKKRVSVLTGLTLKQKKLDFSLSLLVEKEDLNPYTKNFSKDLLDNDGDHLLPYGDTGRLGKFTGTIFNVNVSYPVLSRLFKQPLTVAPFADLRFSTLTGRETIHDYNALLFDKTPYMVVLWNRGEDYSNSNLQAKAGLNVTANLSTHLAVLAKLWMNYDRLSFEQRANNVSLVSPGLDVGLQLTFSKRKNTVLMFAGGILPFPIAENSNFFLESNRPYGAIYRWHDNNGDLRYQAGEAEGIYGYTGGRYHHVDGNLAAPRKERLLLNFTTRLSKNFVLNVKGIYKKIKNIPRVSFNKEYGFFESHDSQALYFFDKPFSDYYLGSSSYEKDPFYAQFSFDITGRRAQRWFFSVSFMAHMGMGVTAFGNGPGSNDIGILDESQANPNSWINGFGRVDGDRGFVFKNYFGYYLTKKLFLAISLKYRDGNPFAFFNTITGHDQRIIYYKTIKAENEKGIKGGPREDYVADISLKLNYDFKLFNHDATIALSLFNIFDFGAELSEYVYSGGARDAMELQIPRSLRLTLNWQF